MIWEVRIETVNEVSQSIVVSSLPCEVCLVINLITEFVVGCGSPILSPHMFLNLKIIKT